jgi:hypothetical protein
MRVPHPLWFSKGGNLDILRCPISRVFCEKAYPERSRTGGSSAAGTLSSAMLRLLGRLTLRLRVFLHGFVLLLSGLL